MALIEAEYGSQLEQNIGFELAENRDLERDFSDEHTTILAMESLAVQVGSEIYYEAANPGYKSSFTRDSLTSMSLRGDPEVLLSQIDFSARRQGKKKNPVTGEEPGKAHHELPSVETNGLSTAYNACDTTAWLLQSIAALAERGYSGVLDRYEANIAQGVTYITNHVNEIGLFIEDPVFSGASEADEQRRFALKVTDWKDSELNREGNREPHYPIVYSLAHFQNAKALQRIGKLYGDERLVRYSRYMREAGFQHLWKDNHFVSAIDSEGIIDPPSSDSLHILLYLEKNEIPTHVAQNIENYMSKLETEVGYRAGIPVVPDVDPYHMNVWTHEQALLNAAARKHQLYRAESVTRRIEPMIIPGNKLFPEIIDPESYQPAGNEEQLWAMATYLYFQDPDRAIL